MDLLSGTPLSWKAYAVAVVVFNAVLTLAMYLVGSMLQWELFR